jgi:hypothetical protein
MGFVTVISHDNYLTSFSLKSFSLFFTASAVDDDAEPNEKYTKGACLITEWSYSCTNMQGHLLQIVQTLQKNRGAEWRIVLTTEYLGIDFPVDKLSNDAFKTMGFSCFMGTEDVQSKYFAVASEIVPTIILYSDLISWVKYRRDYYQYGESEPILPSLELKNVIAECMTQFLFTDMNIFKSSLVDPRTFESLNALISHHRYAFLCEDSCQSFLLCYSKMNPTLLSWNHLKS